MSTILSFLFYSMRTGAVLIFGTTGEIVAEKSGSLNLGVEGMMSLGAIGGFLASVYSGSLALGILAAFLSAAAGAAIYAFVTVSCGANQNVTGLALSIFGVGVFKFIGNTLTVKKAFPNFNNFPRLQSAIADSGIPILRDIPVIGKLVFSYNIFVYLAVAIALLAFFYIKKTKLGLNLRAVGENPAAADAAGANVTLIKYAHIIAGGGITGIGGLYLALVFSGGQWAGGGWVNGFGWISVALVIFANWNTALTIFGGFFFGAFAMLQSRKGNLAEEFPMVFGWLSKIPNDFYQMLPFLITAIVLVVVSVRKKKSAEPACLGQRYYREER